MNNLSGASYRMSGLVKWNSRSDNHYCLSMSSNIETLFCKLLCPTSPTFLEKSSRNYPTNCSLLKQFIKERNLFNIFKIFWSGVAKKLCQTLRCLFFKQCISNGLTKFNCIRVIGNSGHCNQLLVSGYA